MKHRLTFLLLLLGILGFAQTPPLRINYQGVARSATGIPFANQPIGVQFRILQGSAGGTQVFTENQSLTTNTLGLFATQIGSTGNLGAIDWANGPYFLEMSIDTAGGNNYVTLGAQQLVSVPYALYAGSAPAPTLGLTGSMLTAGGNSVNLSSAPSVTLTGTAAVTVNTISPNVYDISTPSVNVTGSGIVQATGPFPTYNVAVTPTLTFSGATGLLNFDSAPGTLPAYSYTANITPTLGLNATTLTVGAPSNTIDLSSLTTGNTASLVSTGAAVTTTLASNSYSIHVPTGSLTSIDGSAIITPAGTNSFDISVPQVTVVANPTLGLAEVSGSFPTYTVTVAPSFSYSSLTGSLVVTNGGNPALSYSTDITPVLGFDPLTGMLSSGPGSNSVTIPSSATPSISGSGAAVVTPTTGTSFTVDVPATSLISSDNSATISAVGTNSFDVLVPQQLNLTSVGGTTLGGAYPNISINTPPKLNLMTTGAISLSGSYPNLSVGAPSVTVGPILNGGLLSFAGVYPNYYLAVAPTFLYNQATGMLVLTNPTTGASFSNNITPDINISNNVIQTGPSTNTVAIISPAAQAFAINSLALTVLPGGTQLSSAFSFTKQVASSEIDVFVHTEVFSGTFLALFTSEISFEIRVDNTIVSPISIPEYVSNSAVIRYITLKSVFSGLSAGPHTVSIWARVDGGTSLLVQLDPNNRGGKLILKETY